MSENNRNENTEFDFSKEIESPIEVDTESISESVKAFTVPENTHSMEEMEYYEDEENAEAEVAEEETGKPEETPVPMDTSKIIHRKGNSGVVPNLELLPTDSIRIPTEDIAETVEASEKEAMAEADPASEIPEVKYEDEEDTTVEGESEEVAPARRKVHRDIELLPGDEIDDDVPVSRAEAEALGDLSYHDEDVKKKPREKNKGTEHKKAEEHKKGETPAVAKKGEKSGSSASGKSYPAGADSGASKAGAAPRKQKKKTGVFDILLVVGAIVAVLVICALAITFISKNRSQTQYETLASAGNRLMSVGDIGRNGIDEIVANKTTTVVESVSEEEKKSEKPSEEKAPRKDVSVNFASIEKDLKIKFSDKQTDTLIKGILFRVEARTPDGKTVTWDDSDKDGVIYMENLTPGKYYVKILNVEDYVFPDTESEVTVKDKISYTAINVINEIKQEKDINIATEAPNAKIVDIGETLADTVGWVDSGKKTVYTEIPKEKISEPQAMLTTMKSSYNAEPASGEGKTDDSSEELPTDTSEPKQPAPVEHFVTGVSVSPSSVSLTIGQITNLNKMVSTDGDGVDNSVVWSTSDSNIVSVDENGTITAKAKGNATITCTTKGKKSDGSYASAICSVVVNEPVHYVTGIAFDTTSATLVTGGSMKLAAIVTTDGGGVDTTVSYKTSDGNIASVEADGTVTAKSVGTVTITATSNGKKSDGNAASASCVITITAAPSYVSSITLDKYTVNLGVNATVKLIPTVNVESGAVYKDGFIWTSSDANIAAVGEDGTITGKAQGSAVISCTTAGKTKDGMTLSANCTVMVNNVMYDTTTPLTYKREDGTVFTLFVKDGENYREAKYADYYKYNVFYIKEEKLFGWQNENGSTKYYDSEGKPVTGEQVIGGVKYNFANDGTLSIGNGTMGIDVSAYQGNIDWNAVKQSGVSFVIIRCGYRGYTKGGLIEDSRFHANASGAEAAGLKVGVYFFSQAVNEREAVEEASMAISMAQSHRISYPIFIDSEYANGAHNGRADGLSKAERTAVCRAFCETIRSAGYTPGVYASKSWYYNNLDAGALNNYKIWLAHYCSQTDYRGKYEIWQNSSKGRINGISGNVDINTSYLGY